MTNQEKYKTAQERERAFWQFCKIISCKNCPLIDIHKTAFDCILYWLEMEAEEELLSCPFCGGKSTLYEIAGVKPHVQCNACRVSMYGDTRIEAIAAWNRRTNNG